MGIDRNRFVRKQGPPIVTPVDTVANTLVEQPAAVNTPMSDVSDLPAEPDHAFIPVEPQYDEGIIELRSDDEGAGAKPVLKTVLGVLALAVLFAASVGAGAYSNYHDAKKADSVAKSTTAQKISSNTPTEQGSTLTVGAANTDLGYETPKTLSADSPYYQYTDTFGGSKVTISRQPIPDDFKSDPNGALVKLANSLNAKQSIQTQRWGMAYMVTDTKNSVQVLVFKSTDKLVFIQSLGVHSSDEWRGYVDSLNI